MIVSNEPFQKDKKLRYLFYTERGSISDYVNKCNINYVPTDRGTKENLFPSRVSINSISLQRLTE